MSMAFASMGCSALTPRAIRSSSTCHSRPSECMMNGNPAAWAMPASSSIHGKKYLRKIFGETSRLSV